MILVICSRIVGSISARCLDDIGLIICRPLFNPGQRGCTIGFVKIRFTRAAYGSCCGTLIGVSVFAWFSGIIISVAALVCFFA